MPNCTAVASSAPPNRKPPSPVTATTGRSGIATLTPSAVGKPAPSVPEKPEVISVCGVRLGLRNGLGASGVAARFGNGRQGAGGVGTVCNDRDVGLEAAHLDRADVDAGELQAGGQRAPAGSRNL